MPSQSMKPYAVAALAALLIAAAAGALIRFGLLNGFPTWAANYTAVRHAHSHLMYFGWGSLAIAARQILDALWIGGVCVMLIALLGLGMGGIVPVSSRFLLELAAWSSLPLVGVVLLQLVRATQSDADVDVVETITPTGMAAG